MLVTVINILVPLKTFWLAMVIIDWKQLQLGDSGSNFMSEDTGIFFGPHKWWRFIFCWLFFVLNSSVVLYFDALIKENSEITEIVWKGRKDDDLASKGVFLFKDTIIQ